MGVGGVAFNSGETAAYMLAYSSSNEYVVTMKDPYLNIATFDGLPTVFIVQSVSAANYRQLHHAALIPMPNNF